MFDDELFLLRLRQDVNEKIAQVPRKGNIEL